MQSFNSIIYSMICNTICICNTRSCSLKFFFILITSIILSSIVCTTPTLPLSLLLLLSLFHMQILFTISLNTTFISALPRYALLNNINTISTTSFSMLLQYTYSYCMILFNVLSSFNMMFFLNVGITFIIGCISVDDSSF